MKRIAVFCVTFHSDVELEHYKASLRKAAEKAVRRASRAVSRAANRAALRAATVRLPRLP